MTALADAPRRRPVFRASLATNLGFAYFAVLSFPWAVELPNSISPGHLVMLASFPVWYAAALARERAIFDEMAGLAARAVVACTAVLIFWCMISAFIVDDPFRAARPSVSLFTAISVCALVAGTVTRSRLSTYVTILCLTLAVTAAITILAFADPTLHSIIFRERDRAFGFFKNPNQFGIAISTVLPLALSMVFVVRRRRALWALSTVMLLLGLMATGSKANILVSSVSLSTCLILFSFITYSGPQKVIMVAATIFGCMVAGALVIMALSIINPRALSLLGEFVVEGEATHSLVGRSEIWAESIALFKANPIFGVGAGQSIHGLSHSHNIILEFARTLGVPGMVFMTIKLLVILTICSSTIWLAVRTNAANLADRYFCIGIAFGPIAYISANFSSDSLGPSTSPFMYSVLFLGLASRRLLLSGEPVNPDTTTIAPQFSSRRDRPDVAPI